MKNRHKRKPTWSEENSPGRWRVSDYDPLVARDKASVDIFWLRDESLEDSDNLPAPAIIAAEIVEDLEAALEPMRLVAEDLGQGLYRSARGREERYPVGSSIFRPALESEQVAISGINCGAYPKMGYPEWGYSILAGCKNLSLLRSTGPFLTYFARSGKKPDFAN